MKSQNRIQRSTARSIGRGVVAAAALTVLSLMSPRGFSAELHEAVQFNISAQGLDTALLKFSEQAGIQVLATTATVTGKQTEGVHGELVVEQALSALLKGSGLGFRQTSSRAVTIGAWERSTAAGALRVAEESSSSASGQSPQDKANGAEAAAAPQAAKLEEIVVTAQRREERLQNVPITMSVLTGDDLDRSTIRDVTEALSRLPGVVINESFVGGVPQIPVRGVAAADTWGAGPSPTAYYLDSVPFGFAWAAAAPDADAYDLDRVEVLYGPQGTLYGASALNGVVRVLTKDANLDRFEFKARGLTSATDGGSGNYRGDMAINVPIVDGKLAARVVLGYQDLSGWIDKPMRGERQVNDAERRNMRLKVKAQPTEQLSIGLSAWLSRADYGSPSMGFSDEQNSSPLDEPMSTDYDVYNLKIDYEFPSVVLSSATSYIDYVTDLSLDVGIIDIAHEPSKTFAQELTLKSTQEGAWRWSAGAIYRDSEDMGDVALPDVFVTPQITRHTSQSYAVFAEVTRLFMDGRWELTAGARYFSDDLTMDEDSRFTLDGVLPADLIHTDSTFSATTPRLVLTWHPSEQLTAYASYAKGFRSGWNQFPDTLTSAPFPPVEPDKLTNYELGAKGSWMEGRLAFNTAVYFMDWQDVQQVLLLQPVGHSGFTRAGVNGESASGLGVDAALIIRPTAALDLGLNFSWNDLAVDADIINNGAVWFTKGERLNESAEFTAGASLDYSFPLGRGGFEGLFSVSGNYTSEKLVRGVGAAEIGESDPMLIARTRVAIQSPNRWTATLFVDNVNNEQGATWRNPTMPNWQMRVRPRTIGVQFEYKY